MAARKSKSTHSMGNVATCPVCFEAGTTARTAGRACSPSRPAPAAARRQRCAGLQASFRSPNRSWQMANFRPFPDKIVLRDQTHISGRRGGKCVARWAVSAAVLMRLLLFLLFVPSLSYFFPFSLFLFFFFFLFYFFFF